MDISLTDFTDALASKAPTPGGGGASALAGALCAALSSMVCNLTAGKKKYAEYEDEIQDILARGEKLRAELYALIKRDADVFAPLAAAYGMPKNTPDETEKRERVMEAALYDAAGAPLEIMRGVSQLLPLLSRLALIGSRLAVSDAGVAAVFGRAALEGAALNVYINTALMTNRGKAEAFEREADALLKNSAGFSEVYQTVYSGLRG